MNKDLEGRNILRELGHKGYIESTRDDYKGLLNILDKAGIDITTYDYYNQ